MIRAFLAFDISEEVKKSLGALVETLRSQAKEVKWAEPKNFHVTVKFFGNVDEEKLLESISTVVGKNTVGLKPVSLSCVGIGCFPKWQYPRVIWAGLMGESQGLIHLQKSLEASFETLGFPKEGREFKLHLTLGRVRVMPRNASWIKTLEAMKGKKFGETIVDHLTLYKSVLTKQGPIYTAVKEFKF